MDRGIKTISILGCGWLGLPLAAELSLENYIVMGSVTTYEKFEKLVAKNILPFHINFSPEINPDYLEEFFKTDLLFINIPPGRKDINPDYFIKVNQHIIEKIKEFRIKEILFISSTSVYPDTSHVVNENMSLVPDKESGKVLLEVEKMYLKEKKIITNVIRFGGLIGADRHPSRFLSGKQGIQGANSPVNLIHLDDCIGIIKKIVRMEFNQQIYNACMPEHPLKKDFYTRAAKMHNLIVPEFLVEKDNRFKIVDSSKLIKDIKYNFKYKSPFDCL